MHSPRVLNLYHDWTHKTGLHQTIMPLSATLTPQESQVACDHFVQQVHAAIREHLLLEAVQAAQDLLPTAPFPWVERGLLEGFIAYVGAMKGFIGPDEAITISLAIPDNPVPSLTNPSPSIREAQRELAALHRATRRPKGWKPDVEKIDRNGAWYVRHHVDGVPQNQLAREDHAGCAPNPKPGGKVHLWQQHRNKVIHGLKEIQRLLDLTAFRYVGSSPPTNE